MPIQPKAREIKDAEGVAHVYTIHPHPAEEALDLLPIVVRVLGEVAGPLINALPAGKEIDAEEAATMKTLEDLGRKTSGDIDGAQIAKAASALANEFVAAGGASFCKKLLKYTTRRTPNAEPDEPAERKVPEAFGQIYQANYGELAQAVLFSLEINFAPSLRERLGGGDMSERMLSLVRQIAS